MYKNDMKALNTKGSFVYLTNRVIKPSSNKCSEEITVTTDGNRHPKRQLQIKKKKKKPHPIK